MIYFNMIFYKYFVFIQCEVCETIIFHLLFFCFSPKAIRPMIANKFPQIFSENSLRF